VSRDSTDRRTHDGGLVVHIAVPLISGISAVLEAYARNANEYEHRVLASIDPRFPIDASMLAGITTFTELPANRLARIRMLRVHALDQDPDVIHVHSFLACVYAAVALPRRMRKRVIYTPHCYSFERRDVTPFKQASLWLAEAATALRIKHIAACSPREADLARSLPGRHEVTYVPNVGRRTASTVQAKAGVRPVIAAAGRVARAKGPAVIASAAERARNAGTQVDWIWIGGGSRPLEERLRQANVHVTGWIPADNALDLLATADIYVHAAEWDAAPLCILEANEAGVPIIARRNPATEALGLQPMFDTVDELLEIVAQYPDGTAFRLAHECGARLRRHHSDANQSSALNSAYRRIKSGLRRPEK
jgi:glycosyltransferase involved in cell wall biosynthesis